MKICIGCQPVDVIEKKTKDSLEHSLHNVQIGTNTIDGDIELDKKAILLLSIPYNEGFKAYIDDKKWEIKKADTMYMALELPEGKHKIVLRYCSPYTGKSLICFIVGLTIFIVIISFERRKSKL